MEKLAQRYAVDNNLKIEELLNTLHLHSWSNPTEIFCCEKGVFVFLEATDCETMYQELCELLKKAS